MLARVLCLLVLATSPAVAGPAASEATSIRSAKVKVKKDEITADGAVIGRYEDDPAFRGSFYLLTPDGERVLYMKWISEADWNYFEAYKADDLKTVIFDQEAYIGHKKWLAKTLVASEVLTASGVDPAALDTYAAKTGTPMTRVRQERAGR